MTNRLIVAFVAANMVALSSPVHAENVGDQLEMLDALTARAYAGCDLIAIGARMQQSTSEKVDDPQLTKCIREQQAKIDTVVQSLIPLVQSRPKALKALIEFHSIWNAEITRLEVEVTYNGPAKIDRAIEAVRTELAD